MKICVAILNSKVLLRKIYYIILVCNVAIYDNVCFFFHKVHTWSPVSLLSHDKKINLLNWLIDDVKIYGVAKLQGKHKVMKFARFWSVMTSCSLFYFTQVAYITPRPRDLRHSSTWCKIFKYTEYIDLNRLISLDLFVLSYILSLSMAGSLPIAMFLFLAARGAS